MPEPGPLGVRGAAAELSPALAALRRRFQEGKTAALARAISVVEDEREGFQDFLHSVLAGGPQARRVGFAGPPGAGKSTLVAAVAGTFRQQGERVGVTAVDPTSPYSGGALLGDRIRMNELATDPGMFIRSMATRGSLGGLATTTKEVIDLMDVFGFEHVLVETVGVGQTELEITAAADTVVVILVPESGDGIQAMKAGLMEIADIFVVNKADRPGADRLEKEIRQAIHLRSGRALRDVPAHHGVVLRRVSGKGAAKDAPPLRKRAGRFRCSLPWPRPVRACPTSWKPSTPIAPGCSAAVSWRCAGGHGLEIGSATWSTASSAGWRGPRLPWPSAWRRAWTVSSRETRRPIPCRRPFWRRSSDRWGDPRRRSDRRLARAAALPR